MGFLEDLKKQYTLDLADFLVRHGFDVKTAYELAEDFWKKNWKKLEEVLKK